MGKTFVLREDQRNNSMNWDNNRTRQVQCLIKTKLCGMSSSRMVSPHDEMQREAEQMPGESDVI
jgi:hypothetical protein